MNACKVLRLPVNATQEMIASVFAREQEKWSPARQIGEQTQAKAEQRLIEVTRAFEQIATVESRKKYLSGSAAEIEAVPKCVVTTKRIVKVVLPSVAQGVPKVSSHPIGAPVGRSNPKRKVPWRTD
jgi:preprotein translocase subunit Sec63